MIECQFNEERPAIFSPSVDGAPTTGPGTLHVLYLYRTYCIWLNDWLISEEQKDDLFFFFYPHVFFLSPAGRMVKPVYLDFWTTLLLGLFDDFLVHLKKKKKGRRNYQVFRRNSSPSLVLWFKEVELALRRRWEAGSKFFQVCWPCPTPW